MTGKTENKLRRALGFKALTRYYDPLFAAFLNEREIRESFIRGLGLKSGHRVLDLGCGTGTLLMMMSASASNLDLVGVDPDPDVIAIAKNKLVGNGCVLNLRQIGAESARFEPESFDRVVSSLVFHHLTDEAKRTSLENSYKWLKSGGELHIMDWGRPRSPVQAAAMVVERLLDGIANTSASFNGRLPLLIKESGFGFVEEIGRIETLIGTAYTYKAVKPAE